MFMTLRVLLCKGGLLLGADIGERRRQFLIHAQVDQVLFELVVGDLHVVEPFDSFIWVVLGEVAADSCENHGNVL